MFDEVFPFYLLYGMTYEQFWHGAPELCEHYRTLHRLKMEQMNQQLWMQGLYNFAALSAALSTTFGKRVKYVEKPLQIFPKTEEEKLIEAEETRKKLVQRLNAWKDEFEKQHKQ